MNHVGENKMYHLLRKSIGTTLERKREREREREREKKIYIYGGEVWVPLLEVQGARACVILVLRECILNAPAFSLVFPGFDDTVSLGFSPHWMVYPSGSTLGDCLPFP